MAKLKDQKIDRPDEVTMARIRLNFPGQLTALAVDSVPSHEAWGLYTSVMGLPGTETCAIMEQHDHISVNGPWQPDHPNIVTAVDLNTGFLLAIKLLPPLTHYHKSAAACERRAVKLLSLEEAPADSVFVPTQLRTVQVSPEHAKALQMGAGSYDALQLKWYTASLNQLPQLSQGLLYKGGRRLQKALQTMHDLDLMHGDVKPANVFVDDLGNWHLGDFGVAIMFGEKILHCTEVTIMTAAYILVTIWYIHQNWQVLQAMLC